MRVGPEGHELVYKLRTGPLLAGRTNFTQAIHCSPSLSSSTTGLRSPQHSTASCKGSGNARFRGLEDAEGRSLSMTGSDRAHWRGAPPRFFAVGV